MTPVPGSAGISTTRAAPNRPSTVCGIVVSDSETALSGGICQRCNPAMVTIATAVERDLFNSLFEGADGEGLADLHGRRLVSAILPFGADFDFGGTGRHEGVSSLVVDDLGINMLIAAEDRKPRAQAAAADVLADAPRPDLPLMLNAF